MTFCLAANSAAPSVPTEFTPIGELPVEFIEEIAGIYFRSILLKEKGTVVPQHSHDHDHATYVGSGAARLWVDGVWRRDIAAGHAVKIEAGHEHLFQALEPNTRLTCVHDVASAESVKRKGV